MSKIVTIIQARMSSSRLPGKVLEPICDMPSILFMAKRARRARLGGDVMVATSVDPSDDPLAEAVSAAGIALYRGDLDDVLARFAGAARDHGADIAVRLTGDCPLIDPELIDRVVALLVDEGLAYASNIDPPTFPDGLDVEAMTMAALEAAEKEAVLGSEREHVTPFIRSRPERFRSGCVASRIDLSDLRWTVDYSDDLQLLRALAEGVDREPLLADRYDFLRVFDRIGGKPLAGHPRNEGLVDSLARDAAEENDVARTRFDRKPG